MNLKDSFRYQNKLDSWLGTLEYYLSDTDNSFTTQETHFKKKVDVSFEDEVIEVPNPDRVDYSVNKLIEFAMGLLDEKQLLTSNIDKAKNNCDIDIDGAISMNKRKQQIARVFKTMSELKPRERTNSGTGYRFNVAGDQTRYTYDVKKVSTIDFDRKLVQKLAKSLLKDSDDISATIDLTILQTDVKHTAKFDMNDTYGEALEMFCG